MKNYMKFVNLHCMSIANVTCETPFLPKHDQSPVMGFSIIFTFSVELSG